MRSGSASTVNPFGGGRADHRNTQPRNENRPDERGEWWKKWNSWSRSGKNQDAPAGAGRPRWRIRGPSRETWRLPGLPILPSRRRRLVCTRNWRAVNPWPSLLGSCGARLRPDFWHRGARKALPVPRRWRAVRLPDCLVRPVCNSAERRITASLLGPAGMETRMLLKESATTPTVSVSVHGTNSRGQKSVAGSKNLRFPSTSPR